MIKTEVDIFTITITATDKDDYLKYLSIFQGIEALKAHGFGTAEIIVKDNEIMQANMKLETRFQKT